MVLIIWPYTLTGQLLFGILFTLFCAVGIAVGIFFYCMWRKEQTKRQQQMMNAQALQAENMQYNQYPQPPENADYYGNPPVTHGTVLVCEGGPTNSPYQGNGQQPYRG
nr:unnamed protein product [Leishmania braziliensis]